MAGKGGRSQMAGKRGMRLGRKKEGRSREEEKLRHEAEGKVGRRTGKG